MYRSRLSGYYPDNEIRNIFNLLVDHLLNYSKIEIHVKGEQPISGEVVKKFESALQRLLHWEPIQYIMGRADFYGLKFQVNPGVLIPRPETEELVHWIIRSTRQRNPSIIDIGTGSGCIAVALAVNIPEARVDACDISEDALRVARANAFVNHARVQNFILDVFQEVLILPSKYHVMVSNPPYVREMEKAYMRGNVLIHEPGLALFVPDNDPLVFYRSIIWLGRKYLHDGGFLYLEINELFEYEVGKILQDAGFYSLECKKDLNGKPRMIRARK